MKKLITFLTFSFYFLISNFSNAQTPPNAFNYSGVARNSGGFPIISSPVGIKISIIKGSTIGNVVYSETHIVTTDAYGLFNLIIGTGSATFSSMSAINWSEAKFYLNIGMDVFGGSSFINMGTTELLSVPYAMHAKTAESLTVPYKQHYIGEEFGGGVIFHLWKDTLNVEHGLIVDKTDLSLSQSWSNIDTVLIGSSAQSSWNGLGNSNAIVSQAGHVNSAAALCLNSTNGGQSDWYLPSVGECKLLLNNLFHVNKSLSTVGVIIKAQGNANIYCTSSEIEKWSIFAFDTGNIMANSAKYIMLYKVRAIRAF